MRRAKKQRLLSQYKVSLHKSIPLRNVKLRRTWFKKLLIVDGKKHWYKVPSKYNCINHVDSGTILGGTTIFSFSTSSFSLSARIFHDAEGDMIRVGSSKVIIRNFRFKELS